MGDYCSMCMEPSTYSGFILKRDGMATHILDGAYCDEHMIVRLKQLVEFLDRPHIKILKDESL